MSDIDFDELDRAVNSATVGGDTPAFKPVVQTPIVPEAPTINRVERTSLSPLSPGSSTAPGATPVSIAPAARRSSGRFMDMVHPSSDMRSQAPNTTIGNRPERVPQVKPEAPVLVTAEPPAWNEPLESPFLADAKVEKRPLGGGDAIATEADAIVDSFDFQGLLDEPEEELLEAPELQERIEATTLPDPIDFATMAVAADKIEEFATIQEPTPELEIVTEQPALLSQALQTAVEQPIGPTSITPQYKEQASSNQESGAMYDTESYHQAVTAPIKKKSGWFTVLWILLLVLLGAGGGWAVYTYVLPML